VADMAGGFAPVALGEITDELARTGFAGTGHDDGPLARQTSSFDMDRALDGLDGGHLGRCHRLSGR
jgi:hypothetical protein